MNNAYLRIDDRPLAYDCCKRVYGCVPFAFDNNLYRWSRLYLTTVANVWFWCPAYPCRLPIHSYNYGRAIERTVRIIERISANRFIYMYIESWWLYRDYRNMGFRQAARPSRTSLKSWKAWTTTSAPHSSTVSSRQHAMGVEKQQRLRMHLKLMRRQAAIAWTTSMWAASIFRSWTRPPKTPRACWPWALQSATAPFSFRYRKCIL